MSIRQVQLFDGLGDRFSFLRREYLGKVKKGDTPYVYLMSDICTWTKVVRMI